MKCLQVFLNRPLMALWGLVFLSMNGFASNFAISTLETLPTTVASGDTVLAYFLIQNNTSQTLSGYGLKNLPSTVSQYSGKSKYPSYTPCSSPLSLSTNATCLLTLGISGNASFDVTLCNSTSCTQSGISVSVSEGSSSDVDANFPYGTAPLGDVCVSSDNYATPETMLGSWAMKDALITDIANEELPSFLNTNNTVYAVGTAAVGTYFGYTEDECGGGCNDLNGYCFALKFTTKTSYQYMIFQSVNIAANLNSFDIYMAGGGSGAFPDSCRTFWGTSDDDVDWSQNIQNSTCEDYFGSNGSYLNSTYSVTYTDESGNQETNDANTTLWNACLYASASQTGFNTQNFTDVKFIPINCPTALTNVTGIRFDSSVSTIGKNGQTLSDLASLTDSSFDSTFTATTTQMQDCKTPSSGYCGNVYPSTYANYASSISAALTAPLLTNAYCTNNGNPATFCSWDNCGSGSGDPNDYCNQNNGQYCESDCGGTLCSCSTLTVKSLDLFNEKAPYSAWKKAHKTTKKINKKISATN